MGVVPQKAAVTNQVGKPPWVQLTPLLQSGPQPGLCMPEHAGSLAEVGEAVSGCARFPKRM